MAIGQESASTATITDERLLIVRGGNRLHGEVRISGAKNAALKALAATLLTADEVVLNSVPMIADVLSMAELLRAFGAEVEIDRARKRVRVRARTITETTAPEHLFRPTRASVVAAGPLLARCGEVAFTLPGGDRIGKRPIDMHLRGFERMGAEVRSDGNRVVARAAALQGGRIYMDYPSHTGTETLLMAATLASGRTVIANASAEPEVVWLGNLLNRMGARISGLGSPYIIVEGVDRLHGVAETVLPDRLEAGTFAVAAAMTGGDVTLRNVREPDMLPLSEKLREAGAEIWYWDDLMMVRPGSRLRAVDIQTLPFPGFPTDSQSQFVALLTQAEGHSRIHERVYEDRLRYTDELRRLGADIRIERYGDRGEMLATSAEVVGPTPLYGARVQALDIRAGISLVLAGLVADGEVTISDVYHIDRGYEDFVAKLASLGAVLEDTGAVPPV